MNCHFLQLKIVSSNYAQNLQHKHLGFSLNFHYTPGFLKLVVRDICLTAADKYLPHISCQHETTKYTDLLLLFIKDLLVMGNQYGASWPNV
jgi:hypothetical protein